MLCEDNFGNMRTLPTEELRARKGGWGMYIILTIMADRFRMNGSTVLPAESVGPDDGSL